MKSSPALVVVAALALGSVTKNGSAAETFTAWTKVESPDRRFLGTKSTVKGWADGNRGKVEFVESSSPAVSPKTILMTKDGAKTVRLYDAERKQCRPWSSPLIPRETRIGPGVSVARTFHNVRVTKSSAERGPVIASMPTRHYRLTIAYDAVDAAQGSSHRSHTDATTDLWMSESTRDPGLGIWLTTGAPGASGGELGTKLYAAMADVHGTPLKRVTVSRAVFEGRKPVRTTETFEVTAMAVKAIPPETFAEPFDCGTRNLGQER
jgi:hypothetical protein